MSGLSVPAAAQELPPDDRLGWGFNFTLENDIINDGDDRGYTNGFQVSVSTPKLKLFDEIGEATQAAFPFLENTHVQAELAFSQAMFTPSDLTLATPDPTDRPYAGIALLSLALIGDTPVYYGDSEEKNTRFDQFVYYIGVVGPDSGADSLQRLVHERMNAQRPEGWEHQIPNRVVGGIAYRTTRNLFPSESRNTLIDVLPHAAFSLGSVITDAEVGLTVRVGVNRPRDFGMPRIAPSLPGSGYYRSSSAFGGYVFAGVSQRYVAYDITLDERPAGGGPLVDRRDWVTDVQTGVVVTAGCFRAGYTRVWRSDVFRNQQDGNGFGTVSLSYSIPLGNVRRNNPSGWISCMR